MQTPTTTVKQKLRHFFIGPDGIRAGWSTLLFIGIFAALATIINVVLHSIYHPPVDPTGKLSLVGTCISGGLTTLLATLATMVMARIEKQSFGRYGLGGQRRVVNFWLGCLAGFLALSTLAAVLYAGGYLVLDGTALQGVSIVSYGLLWFGAFILIAMSEEMLFRGYLQNALTRGIGSWPAMIVLALLFTAAHAQNSGESVVGLIAVFAAGIVLCILRNLSKSLWLGIGFHTAWDWSQSYLYGTPDSGQVTQSHWLMTHAAGSFTYSGGAVGPEGSIFAQPILVGGLLVLIWVVRHGQTASARHSTASIKSGSAAV